MGTVFACKAREVSKTNVIVQKQTTETPVKKQDEQKKQIVPVPKPLPLEFKNEIRIGAVLPVNAGLNTTNNNQKQLQQAAIGFLQGILCAADTLKNCGYNIKLFIYEVSDINPYLIDSLKKNDIKNVIGPFSATPFKNLAKILQNTDIQLISPVSMIDTCFGGSLTVGQSNPDLLSYGQKAVELINAHFSDRRILLFNENKTQADPLATYFKQYCPKDSLKEINGYNKGSLKIEALKYFSPTKNVVFIPSRNEVFTTSLLSQIQADSSEETIVIGLYSWINNTSLDFATWNKFKIHIITPYFINYSDSHTIRMIKRFRKKFNDEPLEMSFRGYDELLFLSQKMAQNRNFDQITLRALHTTYNYKASETCKGLYKNTFLHLIKYEEHLFKKVE